jgi:glycosyltransferase involved in cell wall biosynthesis
MREEKRPWIFIEMAAGLKARGLACKYFMVGDAGGRIGQDCRALVEEKGLAQDFIFTGLQSDSQKFISGFDLAVVPASRDSFGRVLVEAMGLGTPVIAANAGGHREIIESGSSGILAFTDDPPDFTSHAVRILTDESWRSALIAGGLAAAIARFRPAAQIRAVEDIYERVFSAKP